MTKTVTRGVRNNNPGNIDRDDDKWQGMAADQSTDKRFCVFKTPQYGIRALAMTLMAYEHKHGLNTVRGFIHRWAPPSENNTGAYITNVATHVGVLPDDVIDIDSMAVIKPMVEAIIAHENAGYAYPESVIDEALHMAGVSDAKPKPLVKDPAFVTKVGGAATIAVTTVAQYAPQAVTTVHGWRDQLQDYVSVPVFAHAVQVLTLLGGVLVCVSIAATVVKQRKLA